MNEIEQRLIELANKTIAGPSTDNVNTLNKYICECSDQDDVDKVLFNMCRDMIHLIDTFNYDLTLMKGYMKDITSNLIASEHE